MPAGTRPCWSLPAVQLAESGVFGAASCKGGGVNCGVTLPSQQSPVGVSHTEVLKLTGLKIQS